MWKRAGRLCVVLLVIAAILLSGCSGSGRVTKNPSGQTTEMSDQLSELQESEEAASEELTEEEVQREAPDTERLLMMETTYDSSGSVYEGRHYGYDSSGWLRLQIVEPYYDSVAHAYSLVFYEYEGDLTKEYSYSLHDSSMSGSMNATDSQGIIKQMQVFQSGSWNNSSVINNLSFETIITEDILFEWDAETRTAAGVSSISSRSMEYDENNRLIRSTTEYDAEYADLSAEYSCTYDSEGNLVNENNTTYWDGELYEYFWEYEYQEEESRTHVTCISGNDREQSENHVLYEYYIPEISWEDDVSVFGNLLGTWKSSDRDCYLILTTNLFALIFYNEDGIPIPFEYGVYDIYSLDDISTDAIYLFTNTMSGDYEPLDDVDIYLDGDVLTFGDEVFLKQSD